MVFQYIRTHAYTYTSEGTSIVQVWWRAKSLPRQVKANHKLLCCKKGISQSLQAQVRSAICLI